MPADAPEPAGLIKVAPQSPLGRVGCSRDQHGYAFRLRAALFVVEEDHLVARSDNPWKDAGEHHIPRANITQIKLTRVGHGHAACGALQIDHGGTQTIVPIRGESRDELQWLCDRLNECLQFAPQRLADEKDLIFKKRGDSSLAIAQRGDETIVRHGTGAMYREFVVSNQSLKLRLVGWGETRELEWPAGQIFNVRESIAGEDKRLVLYLMSGDEVLLIDDLYDPAFTWLREALTAPLRLPTPLERSLQNLSQMRVDSGTPDSPPASSAKSSKPSLSYARMPIDAPVITQSPTSLTIYYPPTAFWRSWTRGFLRALPMFVMVQSWLGIMSAATRSFAPILLISLLACVITFVIVAILYRGRSIRLTVANGELVQEIVSRYCKFTHRWSCDQVRAVMVNGTSLWLRCDPPAGKPQPKGDGRQLIAMYSDQTELGRNAVLLRVALGLAPPAAMDVKRLAPLINQLRKNTRWPVNY